MFEFFCRGIRIWGLGFRAWDMRRVCMVQSLRIGVSGLWFVVDGSCFRVQDLKFRVQNLRFGVWGLGLKGFGCEV